MSGSHWRCHIWIVDDALHERWSSWSKSAVHQDGAGVGCEGRSIREMDRTEGAMIDRASGGYRYLPGGVFRGSHYLIQRICSLVIIDMGLPVRSTGCTPSSAHCYLYNR